VAQRVVKRLISQLEARTRELARVRKVEPSKSAIEGFSAWITGRAPRAVTSPCRGQALECATEHGSVQDQYALD